MPRVGAMMLVIAAALWLALRHTDRLALRLFALRYALAGAGWFLVYPESAPDAGSISLASAWPARPWSARRRRAASATPAPR